MKPRPYQQQALSAVFDAWKDYRAVLVVQPTGTGKTVLFGHVIAAMPIGRAMVLAHREELIFQAARKIHTITGIQPGIEMAEMRASQSLWENPPCVVSSIQTQCAGEGGDGRMTRFDPATFSLLVIDEAHHATSATYRRVIDYYRTGNPAIRILGVTATPDRADEEALGQVFDTVAFDYELPDAISDGWLVPILQRAVTVEGLDYSGIRTTAGDLNGADLAAVMEYEESLHAIAAPTMELTKGKRVLVFAASLAHAERLTEIFNRHEPACAQWVHGGTPKDDRREIFSGYASGAFRILVNVGVATEGFDEPGIQAVVMARPTKSRALYAQMAGRGTRPAEAIAHALNDEPDAAARRAMISSSGKPSVEILDFVGNSGRHALMTTADILGGNRSDAVVARAKKIVEEADGLPMDMSDVLAQAAIDEAAEAERAARAKLRVGARYSTDTVDPFAVLGATPWQERGWDKGRQPSEKMLAVLDKAGIKTKGVTFTQAKQLITELFARRDRHLCTFKQAQTLAKYGYDAKTFTFQQASATIDALARNGWRRPAPTSKEAVNADAIPF